MPTHVPWPSIAAGGFPFPDAVPVARLSRELSVMLVSPDPVVRDEYAFTAATRWIREGRLDDVLEDLGHTAADRFTHPEIQARTFAPLVLRAVLTRGQVVPGTVPEAAAERWYAGFSSWFPAERDTRGWDDSLGWLHAVAHGADAAAAFAQALPARRCELLELCAHRMTALDTDYRYAHLEDARLARALTRILLAPGLTAGQAADWLEIVADALEGGGPGPALGLQHLRHAAVPPPPPDPWTRRRRRSAARGGRRRTRRRTPPPAVRLARLTAYRLRGGRDPTRRLRRLRGRGGS